MIASVLYAYVLIGHLFTILIAISQDEGNQKADGKPSLVLLSQVSAK